MNHKLLIAAAVAAAFAIPALAQTGGKPAAGSSKSDGGAEAMFKAMDKNKDGSISKDEAKGTPHDKDFAKLDKNKDGKLSRAEHAAAPEHSSSSKKGGAQNSSSKY
jgi:Ca2+-binding EF-hand superfamily protein